MHVHSRNGLFVSLLVSLISVMLFGGEGVYAQVPPPPASTPTVQERLDALEKKVEAPSLWKTLGFKASGFVDVAYTQNFNNPSSDLNQLRIFDTNANAFMPHLAQLMLERPADAGGDLFDRSWISREVEFRQ